LDIGRKFRIVADIIQEIQAKKTSMDSIKESLSLTGFVRKTEIESLTLLARELGFIEGTDDMLYVNRRGAAFEQYMTYIDAEEMSGEQPPNTDKGTEMKLCVTIPPRFMKDIQTRFSDSMVDTTTGQRLVVDDAKNRLVIVSPFIDVSVLQIALSGMYSTTAELLILTSDPMFTKYSKNFILQKLESFIKNRFRAGKVYHLDELTTIAHAKVWCCEKSAFVTSANVKSDSTTENLEIGIYTDHQQFVKTLWTFLNHIISSGGIRCILDTR
jgi:hypothetical protein